MILTMTHMFDLLNGRYSILSGPGIDPFRCWIMEREWKFNEPNVSCVPRDEYVLQRHDGVKYSNTWALIGDCVGHFADEDKPRYACVLHDAKWPTELRGCLAPARSIGHSGMAVDSVGILEELIDMLNVHDTHQILMQ